MRAAWTASSPSIRRPGCCARRPVSPWPRFSTSPYPGAGSCLVTPGTKFVTVGGAIANDIHGKNHHVAGTFGCHVPRFELVRSNGQKYECTATQNQSLYEATIGGLGLTGLITWAEVQLRPIVSRKIKYEGIKFVGIDEFVALSRAAQHLEYTVAWIDCVSTGKNFARGIFMQGDHSEQPEDLKPSGKPKLTLPVDLPAFLMNKASIGAFNALYYAKQYSKRKNALVDFEPFFYPLDSVHHWNRAYGKQGLLQFQCVLPWEPDFQQGIIQVLKAITASGLASFLAVIKVFGDVRSPGMMSFPAPGITLALDFPVRGDAVLRQVPYRLRAGRQGHRPQQDPAPGGRLRPAASGAGAAHLADRRDAQGQGRAGWRGGRHGGHAPVHGDAGRAEAEFRDDDQLDARRVPGRCANAARVP